MISKETLRQIELMKISTRRIVDNLFAGDYLSIHRGRGTEFLEIREYSPGDDDIREIDWNVTARAGRPYVKKFREEKELVVMLLLDLSGSMDYGSIDSTKREKVLELAAMISLSVVKRNNRLGMICFTDRVETFVRPAGGRKQFYRLMDSLSNTKTTGKGTDIEKALIFLNRVAGKGTVVFLVSDFMAEGYSKALRVSGRRFDLIPVAVEDHAEMDLPEVGLVELDDSESGETVIIGSSDPEFKRQYAAVSRARRKELDGLFRSAGLDSVNVTTDRPVLPPVRELFFRRSRMRSRQQ